MRLAIIDLGTNSVRFDLHDLENAQVLLRQKLMVRLGKSVFKTGRLDPQASRDALEALTAFAATARAYQVDRTVAFATSALREARASDVRRFLRDVKRASGIRIRVISGAEEARLIARGIMSQERIPKGLVGLIDIGGGSTEVSLCKGRKVLHSKSFRLGTARLQQLYLSGQRGGEKTLRDHVRQLVASTVKREGWPEADHWMGSSGTIRNLGKILSTRGRETIRRDRLKALNRKMAKMSTEQLLRLPGLEAKRADMILSGSLLLEETMRALGADVLEPTPYALRHGILDQELQAILRAGSKPQATGDLASLRAAVVRSGQDPTHVERVSHYALKLFKTLRSLHGLADEDLDVLLAAALLHDMGRAVSPRDHGAHAAYWVTHADLPGLGGRKRRELVAQLCRWHTEGLPARGELEGKFRSLLSLLRLADALDRLPAEARAHGLRLKRVSLRGKRVTLHVSRGPGLALARHAFEEKRKLAERTWGVKLELEA